MTRSAPTRTPTWPNRCPTWRSSPTGVFDPQPLPNVEYVVKVDIPKDEMGKPQYKVTQEEDVNIFDGDAYLPQDNFPPTMRRGDEHTVR